VETAIVGIVGALVGILLSNVLRLYLDWRLRRERVADIQSALSAEIRSQRRALEEFLETERWESVLGQILADASFTPFVARAGESFVFEAIVRDIHILPSDVIDPVVLYYRQARILGMLVDDMRGATYAALPPARKADIYRDYVAMGAYALELADKALQALTASLAENKA
jgi:hypothetical protein